MLIVWPGCVWDLFAEGWVEGKTRGMIFWAPEHCFRYSCEQGPEPIEADRVQIVTMRGQNHLRSMQVLGNDTGMEAISV
jgi:hypothetical protein